MPTVDQVLAARRGRGRLRLSAGIAAAAALHLGLAVAVVLGPELRGEEPARIEYVKVRVVPAAALGSTRPAPPKPKPPEPKPPEPEPKPPAPEPEPEPPKPAPAPAAREPERRAPERAPEPPPAAPAETAREREGSPRGSALGTSTAAVAGIDNPTFTYDYYLDRMLAMIEARWVRPRVEQPIEAMVHFRIQRDGRITELELVTPSGLNAFDLAALRAVEAAAPFPPLPASYRSDSLGVNLIVR
jgi:TonB family protein